MGNGRPAGRSSARAQALSALSFAACLFVASRLWTTSRQLGEAVSARREEGGSARGGGEACAKGGPQNQNARTARRPL